MDGRVQEENVATSEPSTLARTQVELAKLAGVSQKTVNRALAGHPDVSVKTRRRIRRLAAEMRYIPNASARAMRSGRFGSVALVLGTGWWSSTLPRELEFAIQSALAEHGLNLMLSRLPDKKLTSEGFVPKILREWLVDALLINYTDHIPPAMLEIIEAHHIPSVWLNTKLDANCVHPDDFRAARELTAWLIGLGHRDIAYEDYAHYEAELAAAHYSARDRLEGYRQAMRDAGLAPRKLGDRSDLAESGGRDSTVVASRRWLAAEDQPTAVVSYGGGAYPVLLAAQSLGLSVPRDLTVASFGDRQLDVCGIDVPTMVIDHRTIAEEAVRMVLKLMDAPGESLAPVAVPTRLQDGAAAGPRAKPGQA